MAESEKHVVGSMRVGSAAKVVNGSDVGTCALCGANVWISPSSKPKLAEGYVLQCVECCLPELASSDKAVIENLRPTHVQFKEIIQALGRYQE